MPDEIYSKERKQQLEKNINMMLEQGVSEQDVMAYARGFKEKYALKKKGSTPDGKSTTENGGLGSNVPKYDPPYKITPSLTNALETIPETRVTPAEITSKPLPPIERPVETSTDNTNIPKTDYRIGGQGFQFEKPATIEQGFIEPQRDTKKDFQSSLKKITPDLIDYQEENVVPKLNYEFSGHGFKFQESGPGRDRMVVTAPNGKTETIVLDPLLSSTEISESQKLQDFMKANSRDYAKYEKFYGIKENYDVYNKKFLEQKEIDDAFIKLNQDTEKFSQNIQAGVQKLLTIPKGSPEYNQIANDIYRQQLQLENNKKSLDNNVGKYVAMKTSQGTYSGGIYNSILKGVGSVYSGVAGAVIDFNLGGAPGVAPLLDKDKKALKKDFLPEVREALVKNIGDKNTSKEWVENAGFIHQAILSLAESSPTFVGGTAGAFPMMYAQISDSVDEEMINDSDFADVTENEKLPIKIAIGAANAALEKWGFRNAIESKGLLNNIVLKAVGKSTSKTTAKGFNELLDKEIESALAKGILRVGAGGFAEFEAEAAQEAAEIGIKSVYNAIKEKEMFETPESLGAGLKQSFIAGVQGAIGGLVLGSVPAISQAIKSNRYKNVDNSAIEAVKIIGNDPNMLDAVESDVKIKVNTGELTPEEGEEQIDGLRKTIGVINTIPDADELSPDQLKAKIPLVKKLEEAKAKKEMANPADKEKYQQEMDELKEEILKIKKEPKDPKEPPSTGGATVLQNETTEKKPTEEAEPKAEAGIAQAESQKDEVVETSIQKLEKEYTSKTVEDLISLKKKLYPNPDIESPMSPEEKLLDKVIAQKFSEKNQEIKAKREQAKEKNEVINGRDIANKAVALGSDQGGISEFTANRIADEDYVEEVVSIEDIIESDPDLSDYIDSGEIREYEGKPFAMNPIITSKGEVIDGYNRIAQMISNGETDVRVYRGVNKSKKVEQLLNKQTKGTDEVVGIGFHNPSQYTPKNEGAIYFSDKETASSSGEEVQSFEYKLKNPLVINKDSDFDIIQNIIDKFNKENPDSRWHPQTTEHINSELKKLGFDGLIINKEALDSEIGYQRIDGTYGEPQVVVFDKKQVKRIPSKKDTEKVKPVSQNGKIIIDEDGNLTDELSNQFEKLKSENNLGGLDDLYSTVKILLNGVAQSKGEETVKQLNAFKNEIEQHAKILNKSTNEKTENQTKTKATQTDVLKEQPSDAVDKSAAEKANEKDTESIKESQQSDKKQYRKVRDAKISAELDNLWDDFKTGQKTTSGLDPERLAKAIKIVSKYTEAGVYKLSDIIDDAYSRIGDKIYELLEEIKAAYLAYQQQASDEALDMMDDVKEVRKFKAKNYGNDIESNPRPSGEEVSTDSKGKQSESPVEYVQEKNVSPDSGTKGSKSSGTGTKTKGQGNEVRRSNGDSERNDIRTEQPGEPERGRIKSSTVESDTKNDRPRKVEDRNHVIGDNDVLAPTGEVQKIKSNINAIRLLQKLEKEDRNATPEEKKVLAQFTGWGGLSNVLNEQKAATRGRWNEDKAWLDKYGKYYDEVRALLTDEEFQSAVNSTISSHYTAAPIIKGLWDIVKRLGFKGGNILESSAGVGHILGLMPKDISANIIGYELDDITGGILKKLYPESNINVQGFEKSKVPANSMDLAITNVPFGQTAPYDKTNPELSKFSLHNYFIAKNITKLKPGGIGVFITSSSSMDASASEKFRDWVSNQGNTDFLGAIRLPNTSFEKTANTQVTTDVLIFRKRDSNQSVQTEPFKITVPIREALTEDGEPINISVNEYYARHPEMMLGEMKLAHEAGKGGMHSADRQTMSARPGEDLAIEFKKAIDKLPKNIIQSKQSQSDQVYDIAKDNEVHNTLLIKDGHVRLVSEGKVVKFGDTGAKVNLLGKPHLIEDVAKSYISLKTTLNDLIAKESSETESEDSIEEARIKLNEEYDAFVKKYGTFNRNFNLAKLLEWEVDYPLLQSIENVKKTHVADSAGKLKEVIEVSKDTIFNKRVNFPRTEPTTADNVGDAMSISQSYRGFIDLSYISKLTGLSEDQAKETILSEGLGFENPETGLLESKNQYLSGFVRDKLKIAEDQGFEKNAEALRKVIPDTIPIGAIQFRLGTGFIPEEAVEEFIKDLTDASVSVKYIPQTGTWSINTRYGGHSPKNTKEYSGGGITAIDLIEKALNSKQPEVKKKEGDKVVKDVVATLEAQQKMQELNGLFEDYIRNSGKHTKLIEDSYNEKANGFVEQTMLLPVFKNFPGASKNITLRTHQILAVLRGLSDSLLLAHEVGTGKTFTMQTIAMERKRLGLANKNLIVVKKATLEDFINNFRKLYPNAKLLTPTEEQMSAKGRGKLFAKIKTGNYDAIIITESQLEKIPDRPERVAAYINEQIADLQAMANQSNDRAFSKEIEGQIKKLQGVLDKNLDQLLGKDEISEEEKKGRTVKDSAKVALGIEKRIMRQSDRMTDQTLYFEDLGIDSLIIDEAHGFKRLGFLTNMTRIKGIDTNGAKKSLSALLKIRSVQEKTKGKNVTFATGTPISNTMAELWTMLKYVRPDILEKYGITNFDQFATTFGMVVPNLEFTATGEFKIVDRFSKFSNVPELLKAWRGAADIVLTDDVKEFQENSLIPKANEVNIQLSQTEGLEVKIDEFKRTLKAWNKLPGGEKRKLSYIPLLIFNRAKQAAIDLRLVDPSAKDEPGSKTNKVVSEVYNRWKSGEVNKTTQVVFSDMFQSPEPKSEYLDEDRTVKNPLFGKLRFNLYQDMKDKLVAKGVPKEQIAIIHDHDTPTRREALWVKMNSGEVRILFGSTEKAGTGVNVQNKLGSIHHIDAPARPMDFIQRNGRGIRQGNENKSVDIITYGVKKSLDATSYQRLAIKIGFIKQMMKGNIAGRTMEDLGDESDMGFEEIMANLTDNQNAILYTMKKYELSAEQNKVKSHQRSTVEAQKSYKDSQLIQQSKTNRIKQLTSKEKSIQEWLSDGIKVTADRKSAEGKDVPDFLENYIEKQEEIFLKENGPDEKQILVSINGRDVAVTFKKRIKFINNSATTTLEKSYGLLDNNEGFIIAGGFETGAGLIQSIKRQVKDFPDKIVKLKEDLEREKVNAETYKRIAEKPFDYTKVESLQKEIDALAELMKEETSDKEEEKVEFSEEELKAFGIDKEEIGKVEYHITGPNGFQPVDGKPFPNEEGFDFFIHKADKYYNISDSKTGIRIADGKTLKEAKESYEQKVETYGVKTIQDLLDKQVDKTGISPSYKAKQELSPKEQAKNDIFSLGGKTKFFHASENKRMGRLEVNTAPQFGTGVYFSTNKDLVVEEFGENVTEVELSIKNPVDTNSKEWIKVLKEAIRLADEAYGKERGLTLDEDETYYRYDSYDTSEADEIPAHFISDAAKSFGYDAIIDEGSDAYENEIVILDESKIIYPEDKGLTPDEQIKRGVKKLKDAITGKGGILRDITYLPAEILEGLSDIAIGFAKKGVKAFVKYLREKYGTYLQKVTNSELEDIFNKANEVKPEPAPKVETDSETKTVQKKILGFRAYEGTIREEVKKYLEEEGLERESFSQKQRSEQGQDIINQFGEEAALEAVKSADIRGALATSVLAKLIKSNDDAMSNLTAEDVDQLDILAQKGATLISLLEREGYLAGEMIGQLAYEYVHSDIGYNLERKINDWKRENNDYIDPEVEAKFRQYDKELKDLQAKYDEALKRAKEAEDKQTIVDIQESISREKKQKTSEKIRKNTDWIVSKLKEAKIHRPGMFSAATPASLVWDGAIETVAAAIKVTGRGAEAIAKGVEYIKKSDWYKNLSSTDQKEAESQFKEFFKEKVKPEYKKNKLKIPPSIIRDLVEGGIDNIDDLTDAVKEIVEQDFPDVTTREVRDAITDYGKTVNPNPDDIAAEIRKMKRIGRILSGLEDIANKKRPLRSGIQRDTLDPDERAKLKELREAMKELPVDEELQAIQQKTATDTTIKRLENKIEDLRREIAKGEQVPRSSRTVQETDRIKELRDELVEVKKEHDAKFRNEEFKQKQRLAQAKVRTQKRINELQRRIKEKDFSVKKPTKLIKDNELLQILAQKIAVQEKYDIEFYKNKLQNRTQSEKVIDHLWDGWNLLRVLQASFDFSFMLVQGLVQTVAHPVYAAKAFKNALIAMSSEKKLDNFLNTVKAQDWYPELQESKLALMKSHGEMKAREELFYSDWTDFAWNTLVSPAKLISEPAYEKAKGLNPFKGVERAAVGYLDMLRVQRFLDGRDMLRAKGITFESDPKAYKQMADVINTFTGRASLGWAEQITPALTKVFFSPRNWASVFKTASLYAFIHFGKMRAGADNWRPSVAQKMALADYAKFIGFTTALVMLAKVYFDNDDDEETGVEMDPTSSDFMKIKIGEKRIDPWGGRLPEIVLTARLIAGTVKKENGEIVKLGTPFQAPTRWGLINQRVVGKFAPSMSLFHQAMDTREVEDPLNPGQFKKIDSWGNDFVFTDELVEMLYPMYAGTAMELLKDDPTALDGLLTFYAFFGGSVNVYDKKIPSGMKQLKPMKELKKMKELR